jgi:hypothetical protein
MQICNLKRYINYNNTYMNHMITTVEIRDDVAKEMRMHMAMTGRSFREQSKVINELILAGIAHLKENSEGCNEATHAA